MLFAEKVISRVRFNISTIVRKYAGLFLLIRILCLEKIIRAVIHRVRVIKGVFNVSIMNSGEDIDEWFSIL